MAAAAVASVELKTAAVSSNEDAVDEISGTKADAVRCETLRVSYKNPLSKLGERLTEEVFLDPRDSWCGTEGIIFVTAAKLTALQKALDKKLSYFRSSQETMDKCRHDYLRELHYLLEELNIMKVQHPRRAGDVDELLQRIEEHRELAESGKGISEEEAATVAATIGHRDDSDEPLIEHLERQGLTRECELTLRILLRRMHLDTDELAAERDRLLKILGPMDSQSAKEKVVEALIAAAEGEGATIIDLILAIQDHMKTDEQRQAIEDIVSQKLRERYDRLEDAYADLLPKIENWRATLAQSEEREAKLFYLRQEEQQRAAEVDQKETFEKAKIAAWEAKNDPGKKAILLEMKAADKSNMSVDDRKKFDSMERAEKNCERDMDEISEALGKCEEQLEEYYSKKASLQDRIPKLQQELTMAEKSNERSEERLQAELDVETKLRNEEEAMVEEKEFLEDECAAATLPPPKSHEVPRLENELEECLTRNAALRKNEENIFERERRYEGLCQKVEQAWKEEEEAIAEARRRAEEEAGLLGKKGKQVDLSDPDLLDYHERYLAKEIAARERHVNLHLDARAKQRRFELERRERAEQEAYRIATNAASVGVTGPGGAAPTQAQGNMPVWFRRPEDLKVRFAGSDITAGHVSRVCSEHQEHMAQLAAELQSIGEQFGRHASESLGLHVNARNELTMALQSGGTGSESDLSTDLERALLEHQVCLDDVKQAWHLAEQLCEQGAGEVEILEEHQSCVSLEKKLSSVTNLLHTAATQASSDAPESLAVPVERFTVHLQSVEPELAAAGAARDALWPQAARVAEKLQREKQVQDGLDSFLRDETMRRDLLDQEIKAPDGKAKRALASMRAVISGVSPGTDVAINPSPTAAAPRASSPSGMLRAAPPTSDFSGVREPGMGRDA